VAYSDAVPMLIYKTRIRPGLRWRK
jgi:hypothetical protein